jgi:KDO2-lipid IV(A) lauroyltransferase
MNAAWGRRALKARHWLMAQIVACVLAVMKLLPPLTATRAIARLATWIGPLTPRHRLALDNLAHAFPEKSDAERKSIAREMWHNMGLLAAEYVYLDQLFDYDPESNKDGRIEVSDEAREIFTQLRGENERCIFFTGHTGNFELLPICAATFGMEVTALFRPPNNPYIAKKVLAQRTTTMGGLVPSKAGAAWALSRALDNGKSVGVLVDQKFQRGRLGTFFGQPVRTNPLLPKLLRQHECPVHPARCVRLPGNRFRLELEPALEIPREANGKIDIDATCQQLNDTVERWVREYPGQWMWFHRRWKL